MAQSEPLSDRRGRMLAFANRNVRRLNQPGVRSRLFVIVGVVFLTALVVALREHGHLLLGVKPLPLLLLAGLVGPVAVLLNALEFKWMAAVTDLDVSWRRAVSVTVLSSAANLLPLPGGVAVRVAELKAAGAGYRVGVSLNMCGGLMWLGMALLIGGIAGSWFGQKPWFLSFVAVGAGVVMTTCVLLWRTTGRPSAAIALALIKTVMVMVGAGRLYLCFTALTLPVRAWQMLVLAVSGALGAAVSIVPSGLGVRESVVVGLSPAVGIAPGAGLLAAAVNRILEMLVLVTWSVIIGRTEWRLAARKDVTDGGRG